MTNEILKQRLDGFENSQEVFEDFKRTVIGRFDRGERPCSKEEMQLYGIQFMKLDKEPLWKVVYRNMIRGPENSELLELPNKIERIIYGCGCSDGQTEPMKALLKDDEKTLVIPFNPILSSVYPRSLSFYAEPIILNMFDKVFNGTCEWNFSYEKMYTNFLCGRLVKKHPDLYDALAKSKFTKNFENFERDWFKYNMKQGVKEMISKSGVII